MLTPIDACRLLAREMAEEACPNGPILNVAGPIFAELCEIDASIRYR